MKFMLSLANPHSFYRIPACIFQRILKESRNAFMRGLTWLLVLEIIALYHAIF